MPLNKELKVASQCISDLDRDVRVQALTVILTALNVILTLDKGFALEQGIKIASQSISDLDRGIRKMGFRVFHRIITNYDVDLIENFGGGETLVKAVRKNLEDLEYDLEEDSIALLKRMAGIGLRIEETIELVKLGLKNSKTALRLESLDILQVIANRDPVRGLAEIRKVLVQCKDDPIVSSQAAVMLNRLST